MIKTFFSCCKRNAQDKSLWLSFIAGLSLVFAYAPFSQWWLVFIVLPLWFCHLGKQTDHLANIEDTSKNKAKNHRKAVTKHGFIFALGWFASGISWVHVSIDQFGGMPLIISLLLMLLLCCYLALYPALALYIVSRLSPKKQLNLWLIPGVWLVTEYLRGVVLTGFPWLSLGYSQIGGLLSSLAPIIGEVGITATVLLICVTISKIITSHSKKTAISVLACIIFLTLLAQQQTWLTPSDKTIKVALVQGNIKQEMKWQAEQQWPTMLKYLDLTRVNYDADLIVWPESAIPAIESLSTSQEFLDMANRSANLNNSAIITGIINYNFESKEYFNSLIVLGNKHNDEQQGAYYYNNRNRYYKNHLLPIGEFVPFADLLRPLAPFFNLPMSSFTRGNYVQNNLIANDLNILPLICFEIAFAEQLAANFTDETNILLTVSNDAWFGNSHGPHQHMEIARMRALEFGRPLLRSTNNGVTAITDHLGNIQAQAPQFEQYVLKAEVNLVTGKTPYSQHWQLIHLLLPLLLIFIPLLTHFCLGKVSNRSCESV